MSTASETIEIVNNKGLHARASAKFVNMVTMLPAQLQVQVIKDGTEAAGGSILGLMMLGAAKGDTVEVRVEGDEADAVLAELVAMIENGFGED